MSKKILRIVLIIIVTLIVGISVSFLVVHIVGNRFQQGLRTEEVNNPVVDLSQFIEITPEGYEGYGRIKAIINPVHRKDYKTITFKENAPKINATGSENSALTFLIDNMELKLSKTENLCNGDVITYEVVFNNLCDQIVDCQFENISGTYTVSGLPDVTEYDPFENLTVKVEGVAPFAYVYYNVEKTYISRNLYVPDVTSELKNGDVVTFQFQADADELENIKKWYGQEISVFEKEYVVENIPEYVFSPEDLTNDIHEMMKKTALEYIEQNLSNEMESLDELKYAGDIFYNIKEYSHNEQTVNLALVIYKADKTIDGKEYLFYYPVTFRNVMLNNGELEYNVFDKINYDTLINDDYYTGIADSDNHVYHELVEVRQEKYEIQGYGEMATFSN